MSSSPTHGEGLLDRILDRTVVPGYTTVGYRIRRRGWGPDPRPGALAGQRALVTGAASGLGLATARGLLTLGAQVHVVGRTTARIRPTAEQLSAEADRLGWAGRAVAEACDVSDLDDVRRFATDLQGRLTGDGSGLDILVHNAGVMPSERIESADGHELSVATHVLGPLLMTELLLPVLTPSDHAAHARVILVASGGMYTQALPADDPDFRRGRYSGSVAYARSKRMQVELTPRLAKRWPEVVVATMHPGWADTPGVAKSLPTFRALTRPLLRDADAGADTVVWLAATRPEPETGLFWHDRSARPTSYRKATKPSVEDLEQTWRWVQDSVPELS